MKAKSMACCPVYFLPGSPLCSHASPPIPILLLILQPLVRSLDLPDLYVATDRGVGEDRRLVVLPCLMSLTFLLLPFLWFLPARSL